MNVEGALEALGLDIVSRGEEINCRCPFHADTRPSFRVNADTGAWICHTGCGSGGLIKLVALVRRVGLKDARAWLGKAPPPPVPSAEALRAKLSPKPPGPRRLPPYIDTQVPRWALERGFSPQVLRRYRCGYCPVLDALVIPVLHAHALVYRRSPGLVPKYKYTEGFKARSTLWGLHDFKLSDDGGLILVEGALDALWLRQLGYGHSLATFGAGLGREQARIIVEELRPRAVLLAFDNDDAGREATRKAAKALRGPSILGVDWAAFPDAKDVQELDSPSVETLMRGGAPIGGST